MQKQMTEAQDALNEQHFTGTAGGEAIKVTMTGARKVVQVDLAKEAVDPEDIEMLQDLIVMATNAALEKVELETNAVMGKYTKGLPGF